MWVIFHERRTMFTHIDKNIFALVEDNDILEFQRNLAKATGQIDHAILEDSKFLQNFVGHEYFAKRFVPMTPRKGMTAPPEPPLLEIPRASLFRDVELPNPYSNGR
jgi:hypothetical protein